MGIGQYTYMIGGHPAVTYVHGVLAGRLLAGVTLSQCPEERVGESVLAEVGEDLILNLESRELGCESLDMNSRHHFMTSYESW